MATTYDKASLVMIPSGYKDDKLYSVKPTDGSGDFTFSRDGAGASPATRVNASGLIEKGRENLALQSNTFNTTWLLSNASVTGGQTGYDGSSDAWLLNKSAAYGSVYQTGILVDNSSVYTFSVYMKAGTQNFGSIRFWTNNTGADFRVKFDLTTGAISTASANNGTRIDAVATDVGSGWWRVSVTGLTGQTSATLNIYAGDTADASGTIYIQDAQLEQGLVSTSYIETTTTAVSAGLLGDMPRLDYSGGATCPSLLLEPSRVNFAPHSEYIEGLNVAGGMTMTANYATSPEGVQNAYLMARATSGNFNYDVSATSGQEYVLSVFAKAGTSSIINITTTDAAFPSSTIQFDLSDQSTSVTLGTFVDSDIEDYGNGWYRCWAVQNVTANGNGEVRTNTEDNVNVLVWGVSCELGSYPTSYIPTYGTAAPRGADSYYNNNLASLHDTANGFCLMFDYSEVEEADSAFQDYFSIQQAFNNDTGFRAEAAGASNSEWRLYTDNITTTLGFPMTLSNIASRRKVLVKIESTGIKIFADGVLITSQSGSVTIPTLGTIQPSRSTTQPALTGIKQSLGLVFFSPILTDAECIALTTI